MAETSSGQGGSLRRRPDGLLLPGYLRRAPLVRLRWGLVIAGRPPGPLRICAREKLLLDLEFGACRCLSFSKDHISNANFIVGNLEIPITVKSKKTIIPPLQQNPVINRYIFLSYIALNIVLNLNT